MLVAPCEKRISAILAIRISGNWFRLVFGWAASSSNNGPAGGEALRDGWLSAKAWAVSAAE